MKRKLNVADLNDGIDGEVDQENFNPWTNQQYSTRYYILLQQYIQYSVKGNNKLPVYDFKNEL